jgi:hypothetical protein
LPNKLGPQLGELGRDTINAREQVRPTHCLLRPFKIAGPRVSVTGPGRRLRLLVLLAHGHGL